ncbi:MAG TPA: cytochrome P450 [Pseudonocardiaceae bacterium]|nr:cytochrome P450 [Pseudonocardiaceae bacterium]
MTDVADEIADEFKTFPMSRAPGCPFDPSPTLARYRSHSDLPKVHCPADIDAFVVSLFDQVRQVLGSPYTSSRAAASFHVLRDPEATKKKPFAGNPIQADGEEHHFLRKLLMPEFTVPRTRRLIPYIEGIVHHHIDAMLSAGSEADLVADFAVAIPSLIICELLGVEHDDRPLFVSWGGTLMDTRKTPAEVGEAGVQLMGYTTNLATAKIANPGDDAVSRIYQRSVKAGRPLQPHELGHMALVLLVAGTETTANMIALSTLLLITEQQATWHALRQDPAIAEAVVEELLRYLTVVQHGVLRYTTAQVDVGEGTIGPDEWVVGSLAAANRDPNVFANPDIFDITRPDPQRHLAFGWGAHQCAGKQLARTELISILQILPRRIPTLRPLIPLHELPFKRDWMVYGLEDLGVSWDS